MLCFVDFFLTLIYLVWLYRVPIGPHNFIDLLLSVYKEIVRPCNWYIFLCEKWSIEGLVSWHLFMIGSSQIQCSSHWEHRMEASLQSDLLHTTIYQTKYRSYWLAISDQITYHSHCLSNFSRVKPHNFFCQGNTNSSYLKKIFVVTLFVTHWQLVSFVGS